MKNGPNLPWKNADGFSDLARKFVKFCVVGGSGVFVDMAILFLLADPSMLSWPVTISKILAAEIAMANNFVWNEVWTFRERTEGRVSWRNRLYRYLKFNAICSGGIVVAVLVLKALFGVLGMNLYLSNLVAIVAATAWNFGMNYAFNWGVAAGQAEGLKR